METFKQWKINRWDRKATNNNIQTNKQTNNPRSTCDCGTVRGIPLTEAIILAQDCNTLGVLSKNWSTSSMGSSGLSLGAIEGGIRCSQKK